MTNIVILESQKFSKIPPFDVFKTVQTIFNVLNHIIVCTVGLYMTYLCFNYVTGNAHPDYILTSWHSLLCTLGVSGYFIYIFLHFKTNFSLYAKLPVSSVDGSINHVTLWS